MLKKHNSLKVITNNQSNDELNEPSCIQLAIAKTKFT